MSEGKFRLPGRVAKVRGIFSVTLLFKFSNIEFIGGLTQFTIQDNMTFKKIALSISIMKIVIRK